MSAVMGGWSVVEAAPQVSALAGLIAGFSFGGLTLVVTRSGSEAGDLKVARFVIGEFLLASILLAVASLEWALVSGETASNTVRPGASAAFAGIILVIGAAQMATGMAYLVMDFDRRSGLRLAAVPLVPLCQVCYRTIASLFAFYIAWAVTDALALGFAGNSSYGVAWPTRAVPFMAAAIVMWTLTRSRSNLAPRLRLGDSTHASSWLSEWLAVGAAAAFAIGGFVATVYMVPDTSLLARPGAWDSSLGVVLYVAVLVSASVTTIVVLMIQGLHLKERHAASQQPDAVGPLHHSA